MSVARKKLIEVALPLEEINRAAAREKSIRHGHPSTLHLWWARRPLAACRAVLFAQLVDDPSSHPDQFPTEEAQEQERKRLFGIIENLVKWENSNNESVLAAARAEIMKSCDGNPPAVLDPFCGGGSIPLEAQRLGLKAYASDLNPVAVLITKALIEIPPKFANKPPVNPAARKKMIAGSYYGAQGLAEDVRYYGKWMRDEAEKRIGHLYPKVRVTAEMAKDRDDLKGLIGKELTVIAWLWARRVKCPNPACGAMMPLVRSFMLSTKKGKEAWVEPIIDKSVNAVRFTVKRGNGKPPESSKTGRGAKFRCLICSQATEDQHVKDEGTAKRMGAQLMAVVAEGSAGRVYLAPSEEQERTAYSAKPKWSPGEELPYEPRAIWCTLYGLKTFRDLFPARQLVALTTFSDLVGEARERVLKDARACLPDRQASGMADDLPAPRPGRFYVYAIECADGSHYIGQTQDLAQRWKEHVDGRAAEWTSRHKPVRLAHYEEFETREAAVQREKELKTGFGRKWLKEIIASGQARQAGGKGIDEGGLGATAYADAVATYLAFAVDKGANIWSSVTSWMSDRGAFRETFARQAIPMVWDFAEANPFSDAGGNASTFVERAADTLEFLIGGSEGFAKQLDATAAINGVPSPVVSTDPPYHDNIGYADLSDFFYVWLRRSAGKIYPQLFSTLLVPKAQELVATPYRFDGSKDKAQRFFEEGLGKAFARMRDAHNSRYPLTVFYAFKQAEEEGNEDDSPESSSGLVSTGWETMLEGLIRAGFQVTGTWPMRTEGAGRVIARGANALASSVVLACRPRTDDAPLATRREFVEALRNELPAALKNLQHGSIAPVDLAQAAIGPGMAVFSRYSKVLETDGSAMRVRTALGLINQALDEILAEQEGEYDAETRWALAWFEQCGSAEGKFGDAETLSRAKDTAVNALAEAGIVKAKAGKVQLVSREGLNADWDPASEKRLTVWELTQHLIRALETGGEAAAARIIRRVGALAEAAKDLAYRLYVICDRKGWPQEALAYNMLVKSWPELQKLAAGTEGESATLL